MRPAVGEPLTGNERRALTTAGVRFGVEWTYSAEMLAHAGDRGRLWAVATGNPLPAVPAAEVVPWFAGAESMGWVQLGPLVVRVDTYEALAAAVRQAARRGPVTTPELLVGFGDAGAAALAAWGLEHSPAGWVRGRRR